MVASMLRVGFLIVIACTAPAASAQAVVREATLASPAVVPVRGSDATGAPPNYVDLTVEAYRPSSAGVVELVVTADGRDGKVEIGRFGLSGRRGFDRAAGDTVQRFRLPLPAGVALKPGSLLSVRLIASAGRVEGTSVRIGDGWLHD